MSTKTTSTQAKATMTVREAKARWTSILTEAVAAYGTEREAKLALGRLLAESEAVGTRANLTAAAVKSGETFDSVEAIREAIAARFGSAPSATELHYLKRFAIVVDLMTSHGIGTSEQRETITPGATRAIPAKLPEAKAIAALGVAAKGGGKVTAERVKAGVDAQRSGKAKATKATAAKATKAAPKVTEYTPADVVAVLNAAAGVKVTKAMRAELESAFAAYLGRLG